MNEHFVLKPCAGSHGWHEVLKEITFPGEWLPSKIERAIEDGRVVIRSGPPRQSKPKKFLLFLGLWQDKEQHG